MSTRIKLPFNYRGPIPSDHFLWNYLGQKEALELLGERIMENENDVQSAKSSSCSLLANQDPVLFDRLTRDAQQTVESTLGVRRKPNMFFIQSHNIRLQLVHVMLSRFQVEESRIEMALNAVFKQPQIALWFHNQELAYLLYSSAMLYLNSSVNGHFSEVTVPLNALGTSSLIYLGRTGGYKIEDFLNVLHHEIAHAYQYASGYDSPLQFVESPTSIMGFMEGHALGVEGVVSRRLTDQNGGLRGNYLRRAQVFLCAAYALVCKFDLTPHHFVIKVIDGILKQALSDYAKIPHVLGTAAFAVAEERYGEEIFRRVLFGDGFFGDD